MEGFENSCGILRSPVARQGALSHDFTMATHSELRIISQNGVSDTSLFAVHTHYYVTVEIMPNLRATALRAIKWSGFILKPR